MSEQYPVGVYSNNGTFLGNATTIDEFARLRGETKEESRRLLMNMGFVEVIEAPKIRARTLNGASQRTLNRRQKVKYKKEKINARKYSTSNRIRHLIL